MTVIKDKRNGLTRLTKTVTESGRITMVFILVIHKAPGLKQAPNLTDFSNGTWKPRIAPGVGWDSVP